MKTPQSASKPQKGGGGLSTPTSGRIAKNKGTPASLKVKVLEKNAKLALLKGQDTIALNGKSPKTPKNANTPKTPKNANTPKTTNSPKKNGTITGSPKNAGKPNPGTKQVPTPAKQVVQGKKRKSSEATPNNAKAAQKKSKTTPETSPEVKLGLKIEKLLESPKANSEKGLTKKQKKKAKKGEQSPAASVAVPGGSPAGKGNKKNKRQKKREALLAAKSPVEGQGKKANEPKQTTPNTTQSPGNAGKKSRRQKKKEALLSAKGGSIAKTVGSSPGQGVAKNQPQTSPLPGKIGKKAKKQKKPISPTAVQNGTGAKAVPAPAGKNSKLQKKKLAKVEKLKQKNGPQENVETPQKKKKAKRQSLNDSINKLSTDVKGAGQTGAFPNPIHAVNAIKALIEDEKEKRTQKPGLLDESPPVMVSVDFYYPPKSVHVVRIPLPNPHLGGTPDVLYIAKDDKKHKNDPEESIDSHTQKFKSIGLTPMPEILPLRAIHKEYSQFEEKRKLINRFDAILIDSRMCFRINSLLPRKLLKKKAPIPVRMHFEGEQLKKEVTAALRKSLAILNDNTISTTVKIGTIDMKAKSLVENMAAVCAALSDEKLFPGGKPNVRNVSVKTPKSEKYPVYISLVKRSEIEPPKERPKKKKETVVGEVSTAGVTVAVHPSGDIDIQSKDDDFSDSDEMELDSSPKKQKRDAASEESDDEGEDESDAGDSDEELDPAVVAKFKKANKANDDEEEDESDEEGSEIEKAEQEFLLELRKQQDSLEAAAKKPLKGAKEESDEEEDDEEEDLDDEDELDDEEDDLDDEEDESEDEESAEEEVIPKLVPAKVAQPQKGKGKPAQNGFQGKGKKPHPAQKGSPKAAQKGKPNAMQKGKRSIARK